LRGRVKVRSALSPARGVVDRHHEPVDFESFDRLVTRAESSAAEELAKKRRRR
jgi:hypothetical protein